MRNRITLFSLAAVLLAIGKAGHIGTLHTTPYWMIIGLVVLDVLFDFWEHSGIWDNAIHYASTWLKYKRIQNKLAKAAKQLKKNQ